MGANLPGLKDFKNAWSDPLNSLWTFFYSINVHPIDTIQNIVTGDPTPSQIHQIAVDTAILNPNTGAPTAKAIADQEAFIANYVRKHGAATTAFFNTDNLPDSLLPPGFDFSKLLLYAALFFIFLIVILIIVQKL